MITLGGGCFWCIEAIFIELRGVKKVESGFSGGTVENPTYAQVCTGLTGHVEVAQITFDPEVISVHDLLTIFFTLHDPTTLNRQGNDRGTEYRSVVFYHTPEQEKIAQQVIKEIEDQKLYADPIVTTVEPIKAYYKAEDYHQEYYARNGGQPYCQIIIAPKVAKLRKLYSDKLK